MFTAPEGSPFGWMNVASRICYEDPTENSGPSDGGTSTGNDVGSFDMSMSASAPDPNNSGAFGNGPVDLGGGVATGPGVSDVADAGKVGAAAVSVAAATAVLAGAPIEASVMATAAAGFAVLASSQAAANLASAASNSAGSISAQVGATAANNPFGPIGVYSTATTQEVSANPGTVGDLLNSAPGYVLPVWTDSGVVPVWGPNVLVAGSGLPASGGWVDVNGAVSLEHSNSYYTTGGGS